jgi:peptidylprolyl isomerase
MRITVRIIILVLIVGLGSCNLQRNIVKEPVFIEHESGFSYQITKKGNGIKPSVNDIVKVHYKLLLEDSTLVDNSYDRGEPATFKLGAGQVIKGWDIAIPEFAVGDEVVLVLPPELGYGDRTAGQIPANSELIFELKIVDVTPAPKPFVLSSNAEVTETESGLKIAVIENGRGPRLAKGMRVVVHYTGFFDDMSVFDSSVERKEPVELILGRSMVIKGWEEGLTYLRQGDKARLWVPYELAYGEPGRGPIPPRTDLIFDIEILEAESMRKVEPFQTNGKDTLITESGLQYIIVNGGRGDYPTEGSVVTVHYTGYLPDGKIFDSSVERKQAFTFVLGQGQVIPGWDEGIALMQKKAKYRFIVPPDMAYGQQRTGPIPPNATLIFDVELIDFE